MKNNKAVMVEYRNEYGEWCFYCVYVGTTPIKALKQYAQDNLSSDEVPSIEKNGEGDYSLNDEVRAYVITLQTL